MLPSSGKKLRSVCAKFSATECKIAENGKTFIINGFFTNQNHCNFDCRYKSSKVNKKRRYYWDTGVVLDMSLFHSSQHWSWTGPYMTRGFSPHIRLGGFLPVISPRLNTTILQGLSTITNYYNAVLHNMKYMFLDTPYRKEKALSVIQLIFWQSKFRAQFLSYTAWISASWNQRSLHP